MMPVLLAGLMDWRDRKGLRVVMRKHLLVISCLFDDVHVPAAALAAVLIVPRCPLGLTELIRGLHFAIEFYFDYLVVGLIAYDREGGHLLHGDLLVCIHVVGLADLALFE